jgi:uncharacterized protein
MSTSLPVHHVWIEHIPAIWVQRESEQPARLAIWLPGLTGSKDQMVPFLQDLAGAGFLALSYDPWQHGERGNESGPQLATRVFSNFRHWMWPTMGQSALDSLRIMDWAFSHFSLKPEVFMGGVSMGGDIAVAVAGLDARVRCVSAIIATPDWLRPGMQTLAQPGTLVPPGEPDSYARYFYHQLNPLTHLAAYAHSRPAITFECGADDTHVPPDGAQRFQQALLSQLPDYEERLQVTLHAETGHEVKEAMWKNSLNWFSRWS